MNTIIGGGEEINTHRLVDILFYDAFSVTRLCSVDDGMISE
jgi:hypothetical protein